MTHRIRVSIKTQDRSMCPVRDLKRKAYIKHSGAVFFLFFHLQRYIINLIGLFP